MNKQDIRRLTETIYNFDFNLFRPFSALENAFAAEHISNAEEAVKILNAKFNIPEFSSKLTRVLNKKRIVKADIEELLHLIFIFLV